jgi:ubiquinone/menaquinone biosynthesis C-methylase UbiE
MVSIAQTSRKYRGRKAETYDEVREKQARWKLENEVVERWLHDLKPNSVLDCPVGTGRFLAAYRATGVRAVRGIDASDEMIALAKKKGAGPRVVLEVGDATATGMQDATFDCVVCVRFLDLIDEEAMRRVLTEMCRVARRAVLLTIRLGDKYVPKANTAEHDRKKFHALVRKLGWQIDFCEQFRDAGWEIIRLGRKG